MSMKYAAIIGRKKGFKRQVTLTTTPRYLFLHVSKYDTGLVSTHAVIHDCTCTIQMVPLVRTKTIMMIAGVLVWAGDSPQKL